MLKKKIKKTTSNKSGFGKTDVKKVAVAKTQSETKKKKSSFVRKKLKVGKSYLWLIPPVGKMDGFPYYRYLSHSNLGENNDQFVNCQCRSYEDDRKKCKACLKVFKTWSEVKQLKKSSDPSDKQEGAALEKLNKSRSARYNNLSQVIDLTPMFDKKGKPSFEIPECFGDNLGVGDEEENKYKKCHGCPFIDSCKAGVEKWNMPMGVWNFVLDKIGSEEIDICNPSAARLLKIKREGTGQMDTSYAPELVGSELEIPAHVLAFAEKHAEDLTLVEQLGTDERMNEIFNPVTDDDETVVKKKKFKNKLKEKGESAFKKKTLKEKPKVTKEQLEAVKAKLKANSAKKHEKVS